jgi:cytochrome c oxidase subunit II
MIFARLKRLVAGLAAAALVSAGAFAAYSDVNLPTGATAVSKDVYDLHIFVLWICFFIFIVVFGAMFYSLFKHRKSVGHAPEHFHENTMLEVVWTIIPFLIIIGMAIPATKSVLAQKDTASPDMTIKVTGYQWRWEYEYLQEGIKFLSVLSTPYEQVQNEAPKGEHYLSEVGDPLVVPVGKKVRALITSGDVIHGWFVPQLGVNQYGIPGFIKDIWFKIDEPGTYRGFCSQICGKEHAYMPIVVVAKKQEEYDAWVKEAKAKLAKSATSQESQPAAAPTSKN